MAKVLSINCWFHFSSSDMIMGTDGDDSPQQGRYFPVWVELT